MSHPNNTATAWNPGLSSDIPSRLLPQSTLYRAENAVVSFAEARELRDITGLPLLQLVSLKPERLILHELLVSVTADLSVADDQAYEVLGINLRQMVSTIETRYIQPEITTILKAFESELSQALRFISERLSDRLFAASPLDEDPPSAEPAQADNDNDTLLSRLVSRLWGSSKSRQSRETVTAISDDHDVSSQHTQAVSDWHELSRAPTCSSRERACLDLLIDTVESIVRHRGRLVGDQALIEKLVLNRLRMTWGPRIISQLIKPLFEQAVQSENFRLLPAQDVPLIMNVKGASASGKSTIRPQQRVLSQRLEIAWEDFALISPDYWRKSLLDYESLGDDYLYGAMLTGQELAIIDAKLDRHMARKAEKGLTTHLLIDRFRFDSFVLEPHRTADSTLLTRFGHRIFMFFMITPPTETVERAWKRGLKTGRYKAVDDLLYHNIEAYKGMPDLFFSWVNAEDKKVHFEFLDNDVPEGTLPRNVAYGWNGAMVVLLPDVLMNIDRYSQVNTAALSPAEVLPAEPKALPKGRGIIERCAKRVKSMVFARMEQDGARPYAEVNSGELVWCDTDYIRDHADSDGIAQVMQVLGMDTSQSATPCLAQPTSATRIDIEYEQQFTVGRWQSTAP